ncbi:MAG: hypothetical protein HN394_22505, partial [Rhodospirillaceae bacterium]|nr:hypothetical protein [Rhodospirillaceae bacterium]
MTVGFSAVIGCMGGADGTGDTAGTVGAVTLGRGGAGSETVLGSVFSTAVCFGTAIGLVAWFCGCKAGCGAPNSIAANKALSPTDAPAMMYLRAMDYRIRLEANSNSIS